MSKQRQGWRQYFLPRRDASSISDGYLERQLRGLRFGKKPTDEYLREIRTAEQYGATLTAEDLARYR